MINKDLYKHLDIKKQSGKSALGRGIGALISGADTSASNTSQANQQPITVSLNSCVPSSYQMRKQFNQADIDSLAESIKQHGVLQPILVKPYNNTYIIIAGERRVRASKQAGLSNIPAILLDIDDKAIMEIGIIENLQRQDLNPLEEANSFNLLIKQFNYTHSMVANLVGKSRSYITNYLQILKLPDSVKEMIVNGSISTSHARMLAGMDNPEDFAKQIATQGLSVSQAYNTKQQDDSIVTKQKKTKDTSSAYISNQKLLYWLDNANVDNKLCKVNIKATTEETGSITINYKSLAELYKLLKI